ncbi:hypothetical protein D9M71_471870 [compost metagenome]
MEHTPIEELTANFRRTFEQAKAVRVDQLQWQNLCQLRSTTGILPVDANGELTLPIPRNTQVTRTTFAQFNLAKNRTGQLLILDDWRQTSAAKGTGQAEQMNSFQHAGFAAAVGAVEDIDAGGGGEGHRVQVTHRGDRNATEGHLETTDASA